jgi:hypothetical protein
MAYGDPNPPEIDPICDVGPWIPGLTLTEKYPETNPPPEISEIDLKIQKYKNNYISVYSDNYKNSLKKWFTETTMSWIQGDGILYSPNGQPLLKNEVWKWDVSGESEYGLIEPPVNEPNYDLFDSNWAAQFVVFSLDGGDLSCESLNLDWCSWSPTQRPRRGPESDIHKNCPAQSAKPKEPEPSYLDLYKAYLETNECKQIEKVLGKEYLGCIWSNPKHPCSCSCPEQGASFSDYLAATRTYSTFWDTPAYTPLYRTAQIGQLSDNTIEIQISQTTKDIKLGSIVNIIQKDDITSKNDLKNSGNWMVATITHQFVPNMQSSTTLTLMRDTNNLNFQSSEMGWNPIYLDNWEDIS